MGKLLDMDSPLMRFLNRVADLLVLNLLMIVCCIPVITAGASFTAMHYVLLKMIRGEEGYLIRGFFKSFARNFKQATLIWLLMLLIIGIYVGDIFIFNYSGIPFPKILVIAVVAIAALFIMVAIYVFPILGRFDNSIKNTLKNAMIFAFANLPRTLLMVVFYALPFIVGYFSTYSIIFVLMFGISLPAYGAAWLYSPVFKRFEPETEEISDMDFTVSVEEGNEKADGESK